MRLDPITLSSNSLCYQYNHNQTEFVTNPFFPFCAPSHPLAAIQVTLGGHSTLDPPLPISNRTVKRSRADDSAYYVCESRSPPGSPLTALSAFSAEGGASCTSRFPLMNGCDALPTKNWAVRHSALCLADQPTTPLEAAPRGEMMPTNVGVPLSYSRIWCTGGFGLMIRGGGDFCRESGCRHQKRT